MKVAFVHDWLTNMGGSEKVLLKLHELFPEAPIFTSVYNPENLDKEFKNIKVISSFLQKVPLSQQKYQLLLPFMPMAFEQFNLSEYDLIISSSHACAKGVISSPDAIHICYCHTPMRYAWSGYHEYQSKEKIGFIKKVLMMSTIHYLRMWDKLSSERVDYFIANSNEVAKRIKKYYRRKAIVIHPPVSVPENYTKNDSKDFYLMVSRLVAYKRVDLAIESFNKTNRKLVIIGSGPELKRLKKIAGPNIQLLGRQSDDVVRSYFEKCKAFIFPGEEDFGITPVEAQSFGKPVIAYGKGGVLDTVIDGKTGLFFYDQNVEALNQAVEEFEKKSFDSKFIFEHAQSFSNEMFLQKIKMFIQNVIDNKTGNYQA
ncbi:glycosyltransferase [Fodinisporobacter ferrooxydans]|uniref:Glycosyltransferase n=1 Tax=Fodinisporobacter ferrooxydans TaxID=2901836 RepID=A0ABY4CPH6_9BACL|nr:glycosyltransferase [Alicyclobacillaceae bacterium MYW30-H2]